MPITEATWARAVAVLSTAREVALACHVDPDGDALGSMLALARFLRSRGLRVTASYGVAHDAGEASGICVPPQYTFLPGVDDLTAPSRFPAAPEVFVALDTGSAERLGSLRPAAEAAGCSVVIDHHASGSAFGDVQLVDGAAAATAVLVEELIRRMGGELDVEMAACLYTGLVTDTARFQHPSTTPEVMELGARLIRAGIDHAAINRRVWETHSFGYLKVLGRVMERARLVPAAGMAWTAVFTSDLDELGITLAETEGIIDVLRGVEAAECAMVAKQQPSGQWKVSLRSRGRVDVGVVAAALGGGGHAFAAGFTTPAGAIDELVERVAAAVAGTAGDVTRAGRPVRLAG